MSIQIEVYDHASPDTRLDVIPRRFEPQFLEELNGVGGGSFHHLRDDQKFLDNPTLLDYENICKVRVENQVVSAFIIKKKQPVQIGKGELAERGTTVSGPGLRAWFANAQVRPSGGLKRTSKTTRVFSWASEQGIWYDASQWKTPTVLATFGQGPDVNPWPYGPKDWPVGAEEAKWIWDRPIPMPLGMAYVRYEFDVTIPGKYSLFFAADDGAELYVDSEQVATTPISVSSAWTTTTRADFDLDVGHHIIAFRMINGGAAGAPAGGPAGLLAALYRYTDPNAPSDGVVVSMTGYPEWQICGYPAQEPGWTAGEVLLTLLQEAQARGVLFPNWVTPTFTESHDSAGTPWDRSLPWSFTVGDGYDQVLSRMEELACDVYIDPDNYNFNVYVKRGTDTTTLNDPITLTEGFNLTKSEEEGESNVYNSLAIPSTDGWIEVTDDGSTAKYGKIEGKIDTGANESISRQVAFSTFATKAYPEVGAVYELIPRQGRVPFRDFNVGDWLWAPGLDGPKTKRRVFSLSVSENSQGLAEYTAEFDTIFQDEEVRLQKWLTQALASSLGGTVSNTGTLSNAGPIAVIGGTDPTQEAAAAAAAIPSTISDLTATTSAYWDTTGNPVGAVSLDWSAIVSGTLAQPITLAAYEVWGRRSTETNFRQMTLTGTNFAFVDNLGINEAWLFEVRGLSENGIYGGFSNTVTITTTTPISPLPAPDAPTISQNLGVLRVAWNGLLNGQTPPTRFAYVYVAMATSETGTFTAVGGTMSRQGAVTVTEVTQGQTYWFKLYAVDRLGIVGPASSAATLSVAATNLNALDPTYDAQIASLASQASDAHNAAVAASADAATASGLAAGKSVVRIQSSAPATADQNSLTLWIDTTSGANTPKRWSGTAWAAVTDKAATDAATAAANAASAASAAATAAATADGKAVAAQNTANAKNTVTYSTSAPSNTANPGTRASDIWFQRSGTIIIGQWEWDGTGWQPRTIDSAVIANLDVGKLTAGAASFQQAVADKMVATVLTAGSIQSENINVGARMPLGSQSNRVPSPATDTTWWTKAAPAVVGAINANERVTPTTNGLSFSRTSTLRAAIGVTGKIPAPDSGKIVISWVSDTTLLQVFVNEYTSAGVLTTTQASTTSGDIFTLLSTTVNYGVMFVFPASASTPTTTLLSAVSVFEVIGANVNQQHAELSPAGLRLVSADGSGVVDLTTNSDQFLSIQKNTGVGFEAQATIDSTGTAQFNNARINEEIYTRGTPLLGTFETQIRNGKADTGPLMSRLSRGVILAGFYSNPAGVSYTNDFKALASAQFVTSADREYRLSIDDNLYIYHNGSANYVHMEVLISQNPIMINATSGYSVIKNTRIGPGQFVMSPFRMGRVMTSGSLVGNGQFYAGTTYMLVRLRLEVSSSAFLGYGDVDVPNTILIEDIGPALGYNINYTDTGVGASPSAPPPLLQTATYASTWSRSFNNNGATIVSGSDQFNNAGYLYQGWGANPRGSQFGFAPLGLAGRTIVGARLFMNNLYTYNSSGVTALLGTHGNASAPATMSGTGANLSYVPWARGEGKWIDLGSWSYAGLAAGTIRGFTLGISGAVGDYSYFAGQGDPRPVLQVTYQ